MPAPYLPSYWASFFEPKGTFLCNKKILFFENAKVMKPLNYVDVEVRRIKKSVDNHS